MAPIEVSGTTGTGPTEACFNAIFDAARFAISKAVSVLEAEAGAGAGAEDPVVSEDAWTSRMIRFEAIRVSICSSKSFSMSSSSESCKPGYVKRWL